MIRNKLVMSIELDSIQDVPGDTLGEAKDYVLRLFTEVKRSLRPIDYKSEGLGLWFDRVKVRSVNNRE